MRNWHLAMTFLGVLSGPKMGYGLGIKENGEKAKYPAHRFRSRCIFILLTIVFWWALLMVHFSFHYRSSPVQSSIGDVMISVQTQDSMSKSLSRGLSTDSTYDSSAGDSSETEKMVQKKWLKDGDVHHVNERPDMEIMNDQVDVDDDTPLEIKSVESHFDEGDPTMEQPIPGCEGRYVYVYEMDPYFNEDMVEHCDKLNIWNNWCPSVSNEGLGPPMVNTDNVFSDSDWYETNQFMLERIFHNRLKRYKCLTKDSSRAAAVFVPFYAGFEISTKLWRANISERDAAPARLYSWLAEQPEWKRYNGRDHFMVGGRITWDFRRRTDDESDWGNKLFVLSAALNMTMLSIEASPWHQNDVGIPYPTYFHPSSKRSIETWQDRVRAMDRPSLFSFVGAPRPGLSHSIRGVIKDQCIKSKQCRLLDCKGTLCQRPHKVMEIFEHSVFCLQPAGDSYTRRSTFDAMLAGCIPVFFHEYSAYTQYQWHLPSNHTSYSVLIDEGSIKNETVRIEEVLLKFTSNQIVSMRETVIQTIPRIVYADPRASSIPDVEDAFDIAIQVA